MDRAPEFVKTKRGGQKLIVGDFLYRINLNANGVSYYKCENKTCRGSSVHVENGVITRMVNTEPAGHNHENRREDIEKLKLIARMKERASTERLSSVKKIYREETARVDVEVAGQQLPPPNRPFFNTIKKQLYNAKNSAFPPLPQTLAEMHINGEWAHTNNGARFLQIDDGLEDKILLFATDENLRKLQACSIVYMDGTFGGLPPHFTQLYSIHGNFMGQLFPFAYALLVNKRQETYVRLLESVRTAVRNNGLNFAPTTFFMDFEQGMFSAISQVFPAADKKGCLFHYSQALWRKVQDLGLTVQYREDEETRRWIQRAMGLPLVPQLCVDDAYLLLEADAPNTPAAVAFHDYLVTTWVDAQGAIFNRSIWNHFDNDGPRTNNHVEGWHSKLSRVMNGRIRHNIFEYIALLQRLQQEAEADMLDLTRGALPPLPPKRYRRINESLRSLKERFMTDQMDLQQYLDAAKHVLKHN